MIRSTLWLACLAWLLASSDGSAVDGPADLGEVLAAGARSGDWQALTEHWDEEAFLARHGESADEQGLVRVRDRTALRDLCSMGGRYPQAWSLGRKTLDGEDGLLVRFAWGRSVGHAHFTVIEDEAGIRWVDLRLIESNRSLSRAANWSQELAVLLHSGEVADRFREAEDAVDFWRAPTDAWHAWPLWSPAVALLAAADLDAGTTTHLAIARERLRQVWVGPRAADFVLLQFLPPLVGSEPALRILDRLDGWLPGDPWLLQVRALHLWYTDRPDEALATVRRSLDLEPGLVQSWCTEIEWLLDTESPELPGRLVAAERATGQRIKQLLDDRLFDELKKSPAFKAYKKAR